MIDGATKSAVHLPIHIKEAVGALMPENIAKIKSKA
jgi:hypothetical protein